MKKMNKEEYLNEAFIKAKELYLDFLKKVGLESELHEKIFNDIKIKESNFSKNKTRVDSIYDPNENMIEINKNLLDDLFYEYEVNDDEIYMNHLIVDIIHELIHANRTIYISNTVNSTDFVRSEEDKELLNKYDSRLNKMLNSMLYLDTKNSYIPVEINKLENGNYNVVAYKEYDIHDEINNNANDKGYKYEVYLNQKFDISDESDLFNEITKELNKETHKCDKIVAPHDEIVTSAVVSDYLTEDNKIVNINDKMKAQNSFEEVLTETIATVIFVNRKNKEIDIDRTCLLLKDKCPEDVAFGLMIIKDIGIDGLKWFMTSAFDEAYFNKLNNLYETKYKKEDLIGERVTLNKLIQNNNLSYDELLNVYNRVYNKKTDFKDEDVVEEIINKNKKHL